VNPRDLINVDQLHVVGGSLLSETERPRSGLCALRMEMWGIAKDAWATPRSKRTRSSVGPIASAGSLRHSPDGPASRFDARLPGNLICHHQIDSIWSYSALESAPGVEGRAGIDWVIASLAFPSAVERLR
jgi:hypothetical protein